MDISPLLKYIYDNVIKAVNHQHPSVVNEVVSYIERPFSFNFIVNTFTNIKRHLPLKSIAGESAITTATSAVTNPHVIAVGVLALFSVHSGLKVKVSNKNGDLLSTKIIIHFPNFLYTTCTSIFWGLNLLINTAVYFSPFTLPAWDIDKNYAPEKIANYVGAPRLKEIKKVLLSSNEFERFNEIELMQLFDTLKPASQTDMIGKTWRGKIVNCYCFLDLADIFIVRPLGLLGFKWGKRYVTKFTGDPLLFSWLDRVFFPIPLWGNVGIHEIVFRGKSNATMVYDYQPWQDYFRVLDDGSESGKIVMLGLWTTRETNGGFFTLTYMPDVETD